MGRKIGRSKYNVDKNKEDRTYEGIIFDSKMEMMFYRDMVIPALEAGTIRKCERQKKYELQPKFRLSDGRSVLPVTYVADFYLEYSDGRIDVIDIKGMPDSVAKLKRKLFWYRYPELTYRWISYSKKWGGWLEYEEIQKLRRQAKRESAKKAAEEEN